MESLIFYANIIRQVYSASTAYLSLTDKYCHHPITIPRTMKLHTRNSSHATTIMLAQPHHCKHGIIYKLETTRLQPRAFLYVIATTWFCSCAFLYAIATVHDNDYAVFLILYKLQDNNSLIFFASWISVTWGSFCYWNKMLQSRGCLYIY